MTIGKIYITYNYNFYMETEGYAGYVYFILPIKQGEAISDIKALRMVSEINNYKTINYVFIRSKEKYPSLEEYCYQHSIEIEKVEDNAELLEEITKHNYSSEKRFVHVTNLENNNSLEEIISELADYGFYSEIRSPHAF